VKAACRQEKGCLDHLLDTEPKSKMGEHVQVNLTTLRHAVKFDTFFPPGITVSDFAPSIDRGYLTWFPAAIDRLLVDDSGSYKVLHTGCGVSPTTLAKLITTI
jgi:hypothetical protein